jgi:RNA polymerase sigma-70 factor (ECF subfamily)
VTPTDPNLDFAALFVRSQRRIYGFILTLVPNCNDADEIFQETSLILWKKAEEYDARRDFVPWACGIAQNVVRNFRTKQARESCVFGDDLVAQIAEVRESRGDWLDEKLSALSACMERLSDAQRAMLRDFYGERTSASEMAAQLQIAENALYQRLHRIRRRLLDCVTGALQREKS